MSIFLRRWMGWIVVGVMALAALVVALDRLDESASGAVRLVPDDERVVAQGAQI